MKLCWEATGGALGSCIRGPLTLSPQVNFQGADPNTPAIYGH